MSPHHPLYSKRLPLLLLLLGLLLGLASVRAQAREVIWTGLVYATNERHPTPPPRQLAGYERKLSKVFGYNQFELLSQQRRRMGPLGRESWFLPGKSFSLRVKSRKTGSSEYRLGLELFRKEKLLVKADARLHRHSPIFLRGPLYGRGQLIIVMMVE